MPFSCGPHLPSCSSFLFRSDSMNAGRRAVKMQTLSVLRTALTFHFNIPVTVGCPQVPSSHSGSSSFHPLSRYRCPSGFILFSVYTPFLDGSSIFIALKNVSADNSQFISQVKTLLWAPDPWTVLWTSPLGEVHALLSWLLLPPQ